MDFYMLVHTYTMQTPAILHGFKRMQFQQTIGPTRLFARAHARTQQWIPVISRIQKMADRLTSKDSWQGSL